MFTNARKFLTLFRGAFFANLLPQVVNAGPEITAVTSRNSFRGGKGKGRRSPAAKNAAIHKRAAKKAKGRAINKARHAA